MLRGINEDTNRSESRYSGVYGKVTVFLENQESQTVVIKSQRTVNNHSGKICRSVFLIHIPRDEMHKVTILFSWKVAPGLLRFLCFANNALALKT